MPETFCLSRRLLRHYERTHLNSTFAELFAQRERLVLVGRSYVRAIYLFWPAEQRHIVQAAHKLAVLDQERNLVGSNLKHCARAFDVARSVAEAGIEEAGVVNAKLAVGWIEGNHFCREIRRNSHSFPGRK